MHQILLGQIPAHLSLRENDEIVVYAGPQVFHGKFKKMASNNMGILLDIVVKKQNQDYPAIIEIAHEDVLAIGKIHNGIETVNDSQLKDVYITNESRIRDAGTKKPKKRGVQ